MRRFFQQLREGMRGLQFRSTLLLTIFVTAATGSCGALYLRASARGAFDRAVMHTHTLARSIATASAETVRYGNAAALQDMTQRLVADEQIAYVVFTNAAGRILAATQQGAGQLGRWLDAKGDHIRLDSLDHPILLTNGGLGPRIDIAFPIEDDQAKATARSERPVLGFVRLGFSLVPAERRLLEMRNRVIGLSFGIALLMVPLGFAIVRRIVAPINALERAASELARRTLATHVNVTRNDEIGRLGATFNAMADDLTRAHDELLTLNSELERRVLLRTDQLMEANRQLRIEITEREELMRAVSHDLHAPLRNVAGQAMLLRRKAGTTLPEAVIHCLERIEHNVQYEMSMIDELLELSRMRHDHETRQEVDLDREVRTIVSYLEYELNKKGIQLVIDRPLPQVTVERKRIRHVFQNLIDNAIKYTPEYAGQGPRPTIGISWRENLTEYEFRIVDCGIGVRPEDRERIFNVFGRARTEFVSRTPGKGMGLAYCRSIVQSYRGRLWLEDKAGQGSVFCFALNKNELKRKTEATEAIRVEKETSTEVVGAVHVD